MPLSQKGALIGAVGLLLLCCGVEGSKPRAVIQVGGSSSLPDAGAPDAPLGGNAGTSVTLDAGLEAGGGAGSSGSAGSAGSPACVGYDCDGPTCGLHDFSFDPGARTLSTVHLVGSFNSWSISDFTLLTLDAATGRYEGTFDVGEGEHEYRFVLDGSDWQLDPENPDVAGDNSLLDIDCPATCQGAAADFDWRDQVLYSLLIDRFADSDGTTAMPSEGGSAQNPRFGWGGGDIEGVRSRLDYLQDLGVTALWLSSPAKNGSSGYHGYYPSPDEQDPAVDSRFGSAPQLTALVDEAHAGGVRMLFDHVMKHVEASSEVGQNHPDWFYTENGQVKLCSNGTSDPGDDLWQDPFWGTRCSFGSSLLPFDYGVSSAALEWSLNDALWWAEEYDLDGFRLDAIKHVAPGYSGALREALFELGDRAYDFYLVGEVFDYDRSKLRELVDPRRRLNGQLDFPLRGKLVDALMHDALPLDELATWIEENDRYYGSEAVMSTFLGNHDMPRVIHYASRQIASSTEGSHNGNNQPNQFSQPTDRVPYERLALAYAVLFTSPGIPVIYYGDEIGLFGGGDPENRRMMPWDESSLSADQRWLREVVMRLANLRKTYRVIGRGKRKTEYADSDVWVYRRYACSDWASLLVVVNSADDERNAPLPAGKHKELESGALVEGSIDVPARGFVLLEADAE
jgi:glycosidase